VIRDEDDDGFTAWQFQAACDRIEGPGRVSTESVMPFLDRCCDVGLLTKHKDPWHARYIPTPLLAAMFERD
jgi:hypothetical protein